MSIFFHGALGGLIAPFKKDILPFIFLGMFPDMIGAVSFFGIDPNGWLIYRLAHSIWPVLVLIILGLAFRKQTIFLPYLAHVVIDIPTHRSGSGNLFTPFADPINFSGINWWDYPAIEIVGWLILAALLFLRIKLSTKNLMGVDKN
jgi:hypothetical protein